MSPGGPTSTTDVGARMRRDVDVLERATWGGAGGAHAEHVVRTAICLRSGAMELVSRVAKLEALLRDVLGASPGLPLVLERHARRVLGLPPAEGAPEAPPGAPPSR